MSRTGTQRHLFVLRRLWGRRGGRTTLTTELDFLAQFRAARSARQPRRFHLTRPARCCSRQYRVTLATQHVRYLHCDPAGGWRHTARTSAPGYPRLGFNPRAGETQGRAYAMDPWPLHHPGYALLGGAWRGMRGSKPQQMTCPSLRGASLTGRRFRVQLEACARAARVDRRSPQYPVRTPNASEPHSNHCPTAAVRQAHEKRC
jgi:hypothetical protein